MDIKEVVKMIEAVDPYGVESETEKDVTWLFNNDDGVYLHLHDDGTLDVDLEYCPESFYPEVRKALAPYYAGLLLRSTRVYVGNEVSDLLFYGEDSLTEIGAIVGKPVRISLDAEYGEHYIHL